MEDNVTEYISMIDAMVVFTIREIVAKMVSDEVGIDVMEGRKILIDLLKEEREIPNNIKCWFERVM